MTPKEKQIYCKMVNAILAGMEKDRQPDYTISQLDAFLLCVQKRAQICGPESAVEVEG